MKADLFAELLASARRHWTAEPSAESESAIRDRSITTSMPAEFRWARLGCAEMATRCPVAADWQRFDGAHSVTLLAGPKGSGKTSLGSALYRAKLEALTGRGCWIAANDLAASVRETRLGAMPQAIAIARSCAVLLLDDLGQEAQNEDSRAAIEGVISERHRTHRPTIVTTGLRADMIAARYGDGVLRRLSEKGRALVIRFGDSK